MRESTSTKVCSKCKTKKPIAEFHRDAQKADGLRFWCKTCSNTSRAASYARDPEPARERARQRYLENAPARREAHRSYYWASEETRTRIAEYRRRWAEQNAEKVRRDGRRYREEFPEKVRAQKRLQYAVANGQIVRPDICEVCGRRCRPEGHHGDYSKPLVVTWLCRSCHGLHHSGTGAVVVVQIGPEHVTLMRGLEEAAKLRA